MPASDAPDFDDAASADPDPDPDPDFDAPDLAADLGERPLAELLDVFWQGSVPGQGDEPEGGVTTALDELGPPGLTSRGGRPPDAALAAAYRRFTGAG
ncbi:hypothetical protein [Kitasatospora sp. NPDC015120]|uniref:hypothetical protein n=1 Tax=Kitasatospora sp. NPDC015120 TaxID=3364023 RepID=UPI0036F45602